MTIKRQGDFILTCLTCDGTVLLTDLRLDQLTCAGGPAPYWVPVDVTGLPHLPGLSQDYAHIDLTLWLTPDTTLRPLHALWHEGHIGEWRCAFLGRLGPLTCTGPLREMQVERTAWGTRVRLCIGTPR